MELDRLVSDLMRDEGLRLKPYRCTAGKLTIGYGRNLEDVGITEYEAKFLLAEDIRRLNRDLYKALPWLGSLPPDWQLALGNMAFQLGLRGLLGFKKMLAALEAGDGVEAYRQALDSAWAKQTPLRAERVAKLFLKSSPAKWHQTEDSLPDEASP